MGEQAEIEASLTAVESPETPEGAVVIIKPLVLTALLISLLLGSRVSSSQLKNIDCDVTIPNGRAPFGERPAPTLHGNGEIWTSLWPDGTVIFSSAGPGSVLDDGSLRMKFPWWRVVHGPLRLNGQRLDAQAAPMKSQIPSGYGETGFQASYLIFPTPGCWKVTATAGQASLTVVMRVVKM